MPKKKSCDTYILRSGSSSFEPWDRIFCTGQTVNVIACASEGIVYGLGVSLHTAGSGGNLYFAASEKKEFPVYNVTFDANGGSFTSGAFKGLTEAEVTVEKGNTVERPDDPVPSAFQKNAPADGAASVSVRWIFNADGTWNAVYAGNVLKDTFANISYGGKTYWYHFNTEGVMETGWVNRDGVWYYFNTVHDGFFGRMITGWHKDSQDGCYYYFDENTGRMLTGWQKINGFWYYFTTDTRVSYAFTDGKWVYEFKDVRPYGSMYLNEKTPDGYTVDESGKWTER